MVCSGEKALIINPLRALRMLTQMSQYQNLKGTSECYCQIYMGEPPHQHLGNLLEPGKVHDKKKPSSRFNEEAWYLAEPPKSTKKKGIVSDCSSGSIPKP